MNKFWEWLLRFTVVLLVTILLPMVSSAETVGTKLTATGPVTVEENPHGSYTDNTNQCAKCHSTHQGKSDKLLVTSSNRDTCFLCHDGRGSRYDVKNGKNYDPVSASITDSPAGGFNSLAGFTSSHLIEETNVAAGGSGQPTTLLCTSCHNPHGTTNHRYLRTDINEKTGMVIQGTISRSPFANEEIVSYKSGTKDSNGTPISGMSQFCSSCHNDYVYKNDEPATFDKTKYRHSDGVELNGKFTTLPTEGVPSGVYLTPNTAVISGGSLTPGDYYYIVTASNQEGESLPGYVKKVTVATAGAKVKLEWDGITNADKYFVYRTNAALEQPTDMTMFNLVADSGTQKTSFLFVNGEQKRTFTFEDTGGIQSSTKHPPTQAEVTNPAKVFCLTCHYAHGTKTVDVTTGQSKLKRLPNSGVCQDCHKK